jgi:hypothetical protein
MTNAISAGHVITVEIAAAHMQNPSSVSTPNITIATSADSLGDSVTVPIIAGDQVSLTATVAESISFSVFAGTSNPGTFTSIPLGTLSTSSVTGSDGTKYSIYVDLSSNAGGGTVVSIASAYGGLESTSKPSDIISSLAGTNLMVAGTANYGVCIISTSTTTGTLSKGASFAGACSRTPSSSNVSQVTTTPQTILYSAAGTNGPNAGIAEIALDAAISTTTPAHSDYADTLTFTATGTF